MVIGAEGYNSAFSLPTKCVTPISFYSAIKFKPSPQLVISFATALQCLSTVTLKLCLGRMLQPPTLTVILQQWEVCGQCQWKDWNAHQVDKKKKDLKLHVD